VRVARASGLTAIVLSFTLVACSGSTGSTTPTAPARPRSPAKLTIVSPKNGQVIHGSTVPIRVRLQNARIVPATTADIVPDEGHLHVYIDDQLVSMNFGLTDDVSDVAPGLHVLKVEFVASDHLPFDPRVIVQEAFEVRA
jgi:hypothetical protein